MYGAMPGVSLRAGASQVRNLFGPVILLVLRTSAVIGSVLTIVGNDNGRSEGEVVAAVW